MLAYTGFSKVSVSHHRTPGLTGAAPRPGSDCYPKSKWYPDWFLKVWTAKSHLEAFRNAIPIGFLQLRRNPAAQIRFQSVFCITCNGTQQRHQIQSAGIHAVISRAPNHSHWLIATPFPQPPMLVMSEKSDLITFKTVVSKDPIWETNLISPCSLNTALVAPLQGWQRFQGPGSHYGFGSVKCSQFHTKALTSHEIK